MHAEYAALACSLVSASCTAANPADSAAVSSAIAGEGADPSFGRAADRAVLEHPPRRATRFEPADEAYLIGPYDELLTVLRRDRPSPGHPPDQVPRQAARPPDQAPGASDSAELTRPDLER